MIPGPFRVDVPGLVLEVDEQPADLFSEGTRATATFSEDRAHRYTLTRTWDPALPWTVFCMLNPSKATAFRMDPTVTRCRNFAAAWGCGSLLVLNAFALRATEPRDMLAHADPVGARNDEVLRALDPAQCALVIAAWGAHAKHQGRGARVAQLLREQGHDLRALVVNKDGSPKHPLYIAAETEPLPYAA
jgi:hypothetical protein